MSIPLRIRHCVTALLIFSFFAASHCAFAQTPDSTDQAAIVDTVKAMFAAAQADDLVKFHSITAPGFYLYDNGARFDGEAIMKLMKSVHNAGQIYQWNVTEPDVHTSGSTAWIAYVNKGSVTRDGKTQQLQWLESASLLLFPKTTSGIKYC